MTNVSGIIHKYVGKRITIDTIYGDHITGILYRCDDENLKGKKTFSSKLNQYVIKQDDGYMSIVFRGREVTFLEVL